MKCLDEVVVIVEMQYPKIADWDPYFVEMLVNSRSTEKGNRRYYSWGAGTIYALDVPTLNSTTPYQVSMHVLSVSHPLTWNVLLRIVIAADTINRRRT